MVRENFGDTPCHQLMSLFRSAVARETVTDGDDLPKCKQDIDYARRKHVGGEVNKDCGCRTLQLLQQRRESGKSQHSMTKS